MLIPSTGGSDQEGKHVYEDTRRNCPASAGQVRRRGPGVGSPTKSFSRQTNSAFRRTGIHVRGPLGATNGALSTLGVKFTSSVVELPRSHLSLIHISEP